jgi:hypothetical protein
MGVSDHDMSLDSMVSSQWLLVQSATSFCSAL